MIFIYLQLQMFVLQVQLPDGRLEVVSYVAGESGVVFDVQYEGQPSYPPPPPGGY